MILNHLSLSVHDVAETTAFFEKYFHFKCIAIKGDNIVSVLEGEGAFSLVLTKIKNNEPAYTKDFHIGFMLKDLEQVNNTYLHLKEGGIDVGEDARKIRDTYSFYFIAPGNFMVEVGCLA